MRGHVDHLDLGGLAGGAEFLEALAADGFHRVHGGLQIFARIELGRLFGEQLADRAGDGHAVVGVDVDLAHAMLDAALDLFDRHAPGLRHLPAILVDDVLQFLRHRRRAMHHQMSVGQAAMDLLDHVHRQHRAIGLAREFVGAMAGAHGDGQRIDAGLVHEIDGLIGIGQKLVVGELAFGAVAVFLFAHAGFERAEHAQLAFDRGADPMRHVGDALGDGDIVVVIGGGLGVGLERAVHHHRGEAVLDRGGAGRFAVAVVLMHADRNVRVDFAQAVDQVLEHKVVCILARAAAGLDDDRRIELVGRCHDGQALLHIVDVEGRQAVIVFGGVVEKLSKRDASHDPIPLPIFQCARRGARAATPGNFRPSSHSRKAPPAVET